MTAALARYAVDNSPAGLSRPARALLEHLARRAAPDGSFSEGGKWSDRRLVAELGYSARSIRRARGELVAAGAIAALSGCGRQRTAYRVLLVPADQPVRKADERVDEQLQLAAGDGRVRPLSVANVAAQGGQFGHAQRGRAVALRGPSGPTGSKQRTASLPLHRRPPRLVTLEGRRRELADALWAVKLRASCDLSRDELELVDQVLDRVGVATMVAAAQAAYRANDPPRSWRAWLRVWAGLQPRPRPTPRPPAVTGDGAELVSAAELAERAERALTVACPQCRARPGVACQADGQPRDPHPARVGLSLPEPSR